MVELYVQKKRQIRFLSQLLEDLKVTYVVRTSSIAGGKARGRLRIRNN